MQGSHFLPWSIAFVPARSSTHWPWLVMLDADPDDERECILAQTMQCAVAPQARRSGQPTVGG